MDNIILYEYEGGSQLYVNLTNACSNKCKFCIRDFDVVDADLWLAHQPSFEDVKKAVAEKNLNGYTEIVFCGYGEPTLNFDVLIESAKYFRSICSLPIRINTNGQANLLLKRDVTPLFGGLFDTVSISLNAPDKESYNRLCLPNDAENAFDAVLDFTAKIKTVVPRVIMSVVDTFITDEEIERSRAVSQKLGVEFRVRKFES